MKKANYETKMDCIRRLALLVRDHNHYKQVQYAAAVNDYRKAIDHLVSYAERQGVKLSYKVDEKGYLIMA